MVQHPSRRLRFAYYCPFSLGASVFLSLTPVMDVVAPGNFPFKASTPLCGLARVTISCLSCLISLDISFAPLCS
jgi:hypothetical protein